MKLFLVTMLSAGLLLGGCAKESGPSGPGNNPAEKDLLALGWADFEAQRFDPAIGNFTEAYNKATTAAVRGEALSGRGWSYAYKRDLSKARGDFVFATGLTGVAPSVMNDVRVGAAFVLYALNDFSGSATHAGAALTENASYTFVHDGKVTPKRLRLLLAQSHFALGQFAQCAGQLDLVNPAGAPHSADPTILLGSITTLLNSL